MQNYMIAFGDSQSNSSKLSVLEVYAVVNRGRHSVKLQSKMTKHEQAGIIYDYLVGYVL